MTATIPHPAPAHTNVVISCPCGGKLVAEPRAGRIEHEAALFRWWHGAGGEGKCGRLSEQGVSE